MAPSPDIRRSSRTAPITDPSGRQSGRQAVRQAHKFEGAWAGGTTGIADLGPRPFPGSPGEGFDPLREEKLFSRVRIPQNWTDN